MAGPMTPYTPAPPADQQEEWLRDLHEHLAQEANAPSLGRAAILGFDAGATFGMLDELRGMAGAVTPPQGYTPASQAAVNPAARMSGESVIPPTPKDLKAQYPDLSYTDAYAQWYRDVRPDLASARGAEVDRAQREYRYRTARDAARDEAAAAAAAHPWAYRIPETLGAMTATAIGATLAGPTAAEQTLGAAQRFGLQPTLAQRLAPGLMSAAKVGAAYGAGNAPELTDVPYATMQGGLDAAKMQMMFGLVPPAVSTATRTASAALDRSLKAAEMRRIAALPEAERLSMAEAEIRANEQVARGGAMSPAEKRQLRLRLMPQAVREHMADYEIRMAEARAKNPPPFSMSQQDVDRAIDWEADRQYRMMQSAPQTTGSPTLDRLIQAVQAGRARQEQVRRQQGASTTAAVIATPEEMKKVAAVAKDAGGFTFDPARREYVRTGYALSTSPDKGAIKPDIGGPSLADYANRNEPTFMRDPNAVLGGWRNPATGKWELDVSRVLGSREEALKQAQAAHQKAIFDLGAGETIPVPGQPGALTAGSERAAAAPPETMDPTLMAGFTAYHGSPHVYSGPPSLAHVGTGEDTLMEGYGMYGTSRPEVGDWYRQMLSAGKPIQVTYKGQVPSTLAEKELGDMIHENMRMGLFDDNNAAYSVADAMADMQDHLLDRIAAEKQYLAKYAGQADRANDPEWINVFTNTRNTIKLNEDMLAILKKSKPEDFQFQEPGAIYKWDVSEHAPMLDWKKTIRDQPEVHDAITRLRNRIMEESPELAEAQELAKTKGPAAWDNFATPRLLETLDNPAAAQDSGRMLYETLYEHYRFQDPNQNAKLAMQRASQALSDAGLVGHKYVGKSSGVENYVIYNPERDVKVTERHPSLYQARAKNPKFANGGEVPRMADGGWTVPVPPPPLTTEDLIAQQQAIQNQVAAQEMERQAQLQESATRFFAQRDAGSQLPPAFVPTQASMASHGQGAAPPPFASMTSHPQGPPAPAPLVPSHDQTPLPQVGARQPQVAEQDPYSGVLKLMAPPSGAVMAMGKAQQQQFQSEADLAAKQASWSQEQMKWYADARSKIDADYNATVQDYQNQHIDPNRVFRDRTTGQRALAMVGLLLGGIGSGITGQPNLAANMIQNQIERDIQAQVAEMDKKKNLVAINFERYGNLDAAMRATYMQQTAFYEAKLRQLTATSNAAQAVPQAQIAAYKLREPLIPMMMQLAQYQGLQNMIRSGGHVTGDMPAPWSWDQYMALAMPGPDGKTTFARSPEDRKAAVEKLQKWDMYADAVDQLDRQRSGLAALSFLPTDAQHEYEQHREALVLQLAGAMGIGKGEAMKLIENIVPGNVQQFMYSNALDALRQLGSNGQWSIWETHGSLHNPRLPPLGSAGRGAARPPPQSSISPGTAAMLASTPAGMVVLSNMQALQALGANNAASQMPVRETPTLPPSVKKVR